MVTNTWWLYLVNGILLLLIGFFLVQAGWVGDMMMVSFLTSPAFIYWGFSIAMFSYDMRPPKNDMPPAPRHFCRPMTTQTV